MFCSSGVRFGLGSDGSSCAASLGAPHCGLRWEAPPPYVHVEIHAYSFWAPQGGLPLYTVSVYKYRGGRRESERATQRGRERE